ncbi:MAG: DMT family transporter [Clostridiales bacterium]|nr:DMT family transporter [Clostridiales bacterium]
MILADLSLLLVALFWGGGFVAVKEAINSITPFYMIAIRFGIANLILLAIFWKRFKNINWQDIKISIIVGIFLFLAFSAQTTGAQYTTAGKQAFLTAVNVVIVPFLTWILYKNELDAYSIIASVFCLIGVGFLTLKDGLSINIGDFLTLVCAFLFAVHIALLGEYAKKVDTIVLSIIQMATASVLALVCALFTEPVPESLPANAYFSMVYMIIFSTMLAFMIQTIAQKYTTANHASLILCLEAVFGSVLAAIFLGDVFTPSMIIGCGLIFIGIIIAETKLKFLQSNKKEAEVKI